MSDDHPKWRLPLRRKVELPAAQSPPSFGEGVKKAFRNDTRMEARFRNLVRL